jgi:hypothetical protein
MAIATSTAILIGAAVAAAGTGFQISEARGARAEAKRQGDEERRRQEKLRGDLSAHQASQESAAKERQTRLEARRRQRALSGAGQGRADTLLTGPSGIAQAAAPERKTLLGA